MKEIEDKLEEMVEPFARMRKIIEKIFSACEDSKMIPPISKDTNGTARYLLRNKYCIKDNSTGIWMPPLYKMKKRALMEKPIAKSLSYIVEITQDGSHSKKGLHLYVDKYFERTKDTFLLKSVAFNLIGIIKWYALSLQAYQDKIYNERELWEKVK